MGGYLADVVDSAENNFLKAVLNAVNPKVREVISSYVLCPMSYALCPIPRTAPTTGWEGWTLTGTRGCSGSQVGDRVHYSGGQ